MCQLGGSLAEKDLGILVDTTVNMSQQSAFATKANDVTGFPSNIIPSCIIPSNRVSKVILPLYSALERPHLECSVCFWLHETHGQTGESPTKGHKDDVDYELEHPPCGEQLRELGLLSLDKKRLRRSYQCV